MTMMIEQKNEHTGVSDIDAHLDRVFQLLKRGLSEPVIGIYRTKLNASLDLRAIRAILHETQPDLDTTHLNEKEMVEQLDLHAWITLILQRWELFEPILKNTGKNAVERLQAIYLEGLDEQPISPQDALYAAVSAHEMLTELIAPIQAQEIAVIRDVLLAMDQRDVVKGSAENVLAPSDDKVNGQLETVATPTPASGAHAGNGFLISSNGHGTPNSPELLPVKVEVAEKAPAVRVDKSRTRRVAPPSSKSVLQVEIVQPHGDAVAQKIDLTKPSLLIGRSLMADIQVNDPRVSRVHLLIAGTQESGIRVTDLHSANGTYLDGLPLTPNSATPWETGQSITIGETLLILRQVV